jgi:hypothetical protein
MADKVHLNFETKERKMKRLILFIITWLSLAPLASAQPHKGRQPPRAGRQLTVAIAQRVLNKQINEASVNNMIFTCRACYSDEDKGENDNFAVVSTYPGMNQFLRSYGYIRLNQKREEVFTAKAKRSKNFEAYGNGYGGFGGAGFRFANFKNPRIMAGKITDSKHVPIEYDRVPTEVTMSFFGRAERVKSFASFSYEDGKWVICIECRN